MPARSKAARETSRKTSEELRETGERVALAGTDLVQRNAELARECWLMSSKMAAQFAEQSARQFSRALGISPGISRDESRGAGQQPSTNINAMTTVAEGVQDISREWMTFVQSRIQQNLEALNALTRCRTPQDIASMHTDLISANLEGVLQSARRTAEISTRMADRCAEAIGGSVNFKRSAT